ncbi:MAG TPA: PilC/PilY family type IV pilus protein [Thermoanaerobaculia bacterium]|nr:PilC/PilY family type IV pilus protein [Thermoanaerobaculia bacterium]
MNETRAGRTHRRPAAAQPLLALAAALAFAVSARPVQADDRNLVTQANATPYLMIVLDTSGSMHQSVACSKTDLDAHNCFMLCPNGDCLPELMADDPASKIYTAKSAIYTLLSTHPNINFGFSHFDQGGLHMHWKYWWYEVAPGQTPFTIANNTPFPAIGQREIFGEQAWACTDARKDNTNQSQDPVPLRFVGCPVANNPVVAGEQVNRGPIAGQTNPVPAHMDNAWEWERARRYPKLGDNNDAFASNANNRPWFYYFQETSGPTDPVRNPIYRITFTSVAAGGGFTQVLGDTNIQVNISVDQCNAATPDCSRFANVGKKNFSFTRNDPTTGLIPEMVYWEPGEGVNGQLNDTATGGGAFYGNTAREFTADRNANAIDHNGDDAANDQRCSGNPSFCVDMSQPTTVDPLGRLVTWTPSGGGGPLPVFGLGDITPLDWKDNHQSLIRTRMAPNLLDPTKTTPDFGIATYFADHRQGSGEDQLRLKDTAQRPLGPDGGTPTGHALNDFLTMMAAWAPAAQNPVTGDPNFLCKKTYALLLTDGLASGGDGTSGGTNPSICPTESSQNPSSGYACCVAEAMRRFSFTGSTGTINYPIRTYVIGLGLTKLNLTGFNNTLDCVSQDSGTSLVKHYFNDYVSPPSCDPNTQTCTAPFCDPNKQTCDTTCTKAAPCDGPGPILPQSNQAVLDALQFIFNVIQTQAASFSAAAEPVGQAGVQDKAFLTSFLPLNQPVWPGRIDAYIKPIPVKNVNEKLADGTSVTRAVPDPSIACTSPGQIACHLWNVGGDSSANPDVMLPQAKAGLDTVGNSAGQRRVFYLGSTGSLTNQRLSFQWPAGSDVNGQTDLEAAMGLCAPFDTTCSRKATNMQAAQQAINYTLQVKTYSDPTTGQPVSYILGDIFHSNPQVLGSPINFQYFSSNVDNYQIFANAERFRRKVLLVGADDGALHAFDIGTLQQGTFNGQPAWTYSNGTGKEIFAYIPRTVMPTLQQTAAKASGPLGGGTQSFTVDGTPVLAEAYFDPTGAVTYCGTPPSSTVPGNGDCQWRSIAIGGLREGGRGYYALDVTQPDTLHADNEIPNITASPAIVRPSVSASTFLPDCIPAGTANCGPTTNGYVPEYPKPLWEFTDSCLVVPTCTSNCQTKPCDEDPTGGPGAGQPDLGNTWSAPNTGRILICTDSSCATKQERFVAIFGGGVDAAGDGAQGNYLYMVDIPSGQVLYKQRLLGGAPSEPAAVDTKQSGFIDTIYIGSTGGYLYKVDVSTPAPLKVIPGIGTRIDPAFWVPFAIFDTAGPGLPRKGRPIYYPPSVIFVGATGQFALAFGTGNRVDLWNTSNQTGRFFVMLDNGLLSTTTGLPFTAGNYFQINPDDPQQSASANLLTNPPTGKNPGFFFELNTEERLVTTPFALSGVLIFSAFQPKVIHPPSSTTGNCVDTGDARIFTVLTTSGNSLLATQARYTIVTGSLSASINVEGSTPTNPGSSSNQSIPPNNQQLNASLRAIRTELMKLFPANCKFPSFNTNISVGRMDTGQDLVAAVPTCIIEKNWKEF